MRNSEKCCHPIQKQIIFPVFTILEVIISISEKPIMYT